MFKVRNLMYAVLREISVIKGNFFGVSAAFPQNSYLSWQIFLTWTKCFRIKMDVYYVGLYPLSCVCKQHHERLNVQRFNTQWEVIRAYTMHVNVMFLFFFQKLWYKSLFPQQHWEEWCTFTNEWCHKVNDEVTPWILHTASYQKQTTHFC